MTAMTPTIEMTQLRAYNESIRQGVPSLVDELRRVLGAKLVAYIAGVRETRAVRDWIDGTRKPSPNAVQTLRLTYRIVRLVEQSEGTGVVAPWFQGMNPQLGDRSPARVLHEDRTEQAHLAVLNAANLFVGA